MFLKGILHYASNLYVHTTPYEQMTVSVSSFSCYSTQVEPNVIGSTLTIHGTPINKYLQKKGDL